MKTNDKPGEFRGRGEVRLVRLLPGPIERVWEFLINPEKRERWFAGGPMDGRKGGKIRFRFRHANLAPDEVPPEEYQKFHDPGAELVCTVTRWDPPQVLAFTFGSDEESVVTIELSTVGRRVRLILTHRATGTDVPALTNFAAGWHLHLTHLIALLERRPRPPFWPMHAKLEAAYERRRDRNRR